LIAVGPNLPDRDHQVRLAINAVSLVIFVPSAPQGEIAQHGPLRDPGNRPPDDHNRPLDDVTLRIRTQIDGPQPRIEDGVQSASITEVQENILDNGLRAPENILAARVPGSHPAVMVERVLPHVGRNTDQTVDVGHQEDPLVLRPTRRSSWNARSQEDVLAVAVPLTRSRAVQSALASFHVTDLLHRGDPLPTLLIPEILENRR